MIAAPGDVRPKTGAERHLFTSNRVNSGNLAHFAARNGADVQRFSPTNGPKPRFSAKAVRHGGAVVPTTGQPPTQQATTTSAPSATTTTREVTMDADTYGRLVERGGYATGGTVVLGFDGSASGVTSMVAYDTANGSYTVIDERHTLPREDLDRYYLNRPIFSTAPTAGKPIDWTGQVEAWSEAFSQAREAGRVEWLLPNEHEGYVKPAIGVTREHLRRPPHYINPLGPPLLPMPNMSNAEFLRTMVITRV